MNPLNPSILHREINLLANDIERLMPDLREQLQGVNLSQIERLSFVGSGDSYFAGMVTSFVLRSWFGLRANAITAFEFLSYPIQLQEHRSSLIVAASASGNTPRVVQALAEARYRGATTMAVTSNPGAELCRHADFSLITELLNKEASPGVRTYQVTLLSLFLIGMQSASHQGFLCPRLVEEFEGLGEAVSESVQIMNQPIRRVVEWVANAPAFIVAGSGPNRGTALYAAAKFVESLGRLATGIDIDEWFHIERHLMNPDIPIILIAPPGNSIQQAIKVANMATNLGQSVFFVTAERVPLPIQANRISVSGKISESLSPLLYYIFAPMLAGFCAEQAGTNLFPNRAISL